jgi:hypothetical protein
LRLLNHVASLSDTLEHGLDEAEHDKNGSYADDSQAYAEGPTLTAALDSLSAKAYTFCVWAKGNGLALNGGKTQLLICGDCRKALESSITVDGKVVKTS